MANTIIFDLDGTIANIDKRRDMSKKIDGSCLLYTSDAADE